MPAFLKRSDKAVHLEGCGLILVLTACPLPKSKIYCESKNIDTLSTAILSSYRQRFVVRC